MTSSTSIKIDDETGIYLKTPNIIGLNAISVNNLGEPLYQIILLFMVH